MKNKIINILKGIGIILLIAFLIGLIPSSIVMMHLAYEFNNIGLLIGSTAESLLSVFALILLLFCIK